MEDVKFQKEYHPVIFSSGFGNFFIVVPMVIMFVYYIKQFLSNGYDGKYMRSILLFGYWLYICISSIIVSIRSGIFLEEKTLTIKCGKIWSSPSVEKLKKSYEDIECVTILGGYSIFKKLNSVYIKFKDLEGKKSVSGIRNCKDLAYELKNKGVRVIRSDMEYLTWKDKEI